MLETNHIYKNADMFDRLHTEKNLYQYGLKVRKNFVVLSYESFRTYENV